MQSEHWTVGAAGIVVAVQLEQPVCAQRETLELERVVVVAEAVTLQPLTVEVPVLQTWVVVELMTVGVHVTK